MPGALLAIGGAEDRLGAASILARFAGLAGGADARIAVVATASEYGPQVLASYRSVFERLGVESVTALDPQTRAEADALRLDRSTGIFLTGGNQLRLTTILVGTRLGEDIRRAHDGGAVVAGTSAGASALATHMVSFGAPGATPRHRMSQLSAGLGLLPGAIVDQHFTQRNRIGRLLSLVATSPAQLGLGVDEDTAAVIADGVLEVVGRGAVTLVDGRAVTTDAHEARRGAPLLISGAVLHTLPAGARFDLAERQLMTSYAEPPAPLARRAVRTGKEGVRGRKPEAAE